MRPVLNKLIPELICSNIERSLDFYVNILGFKILYQRPEDEFAMLDRQGAQIMIEGTVGRKWITGELSEPYGRGINFDIKTTQVEDLYNSLKKNGCQFFLDLEEKWYRADDFLVGIRQFLIQDPDGYLLRFAEKFGTKPVGSP